MTVLEQIVNSFKAPFATLTPEETPETGIIVATWVASTVLVTSLLKR